MEREPGSRPGIGIPVLRFCRGHLGPHGFKRPAEVFLSQISGYGFYTGRNRNGVFRRKCEAFDRGKFGGSRAQPAPAPGQCRTDRHRPDREIVSSSLHLAQRRHRTVENQCDPAGPGHVAGVGGRYLRGKYWGTGDQKSINKFTAQNRSVGFLRLWPQAEYISPACDQLLFRLQGKDVAVPLFRSPDVIRDDQICFD